jgi:DNA-binding protein HU-beta
VNVETYGSRTDADSDLLQRLEALASQVETDDQPVLGGGPVMAASLTSLLSEVSAMRSDLDAVRGQLGGPGVAMVSGAPEDVVEERLAAIEDSLDGLAERFEALARDSAMDAGERLASLDDRLAALANAVQAERATAAEHRERTALVMQEQSSTLDEWAEAVRSGLEQLGEAVTSSLGSLSASVAGSTSGAGEFDRRHLEALVVELSQTVEDSFGSVRDQIESFQGPLDGRIEELHHAVLDGFGSARARLVEEISGTIDCLEQANAATRTTVETELVELRGDLADALDEVRERVEATVAGASESIATTVGGVDQSVAASLAEATESMATTLTGAHEAMATTLLDTNESLTSSLQDHQAATRSLRKDFVSAAESSADSGARVVAMQEVVTRLDATLSDLQSDWRPQVDAVVAQGHAAAQSVLEEVQAELDVALKEMRTSLHGQVESIDQVTGSLGGTTERLVAAGQALLAYLGERDRWLERERDRVLHEVLDEFAQGLSAKERRAVSSRMGEALDRRRDARDAERYRRTQEGKPAIEIPPVPPEFADEAQPAVAEPPPGTGPDATAPAGTTAGAQPATTTAAETTAGRTAKKAASPAKKTTAAKKTAAKKTSATAKKTSATAKKASPTAKKTAAKKARSTRSGSAQTGAKKAAETASTGGRGTPSG